MENASKALLIAGALLLSIMILTVGIILYNNFSDTTKKYSDNLSATELAKFNAKFEVFRGRTDVTEQEIVSLINIVAEYKKKTPMDVAISINGNSYTDTIRFLEDNLGTKFTCENIEYNSAGEVNKISFIRNI